MNQPFHFVKAYFWRDFLDSTNGYIGGRAAGMTLCDFLNPAVPLAERVRHDLGVTFAGACMGVWWFGIRIGVPK